MDDKFFSTPEQLMFDPQPIDGSAMPKEHVEMLQQIVSHPEFTALLEQKILDPFKTKVQGKDQSRVSNVPRPTVMAGGGNGPL